MARADAVAYTGRVKLGLLAAALGAGAALPYIVSPFMVAIVTLALVFGLYAMSIDLLAGFGGLVPLGHAGIFAAAAYGVGYVATRPQGDHVQQIAAGLATGLAVTVIFAVMAMRTRGVYFLMVTLAQGMVIWGLSMRLVSVTGAENGLRGILRPPAVSAYWKYYYLVLAIVAIAGGVMWVITRSPFGLALRGLRDGEERLRILGYNTAFHKAYAFVLSGFFASVAGVLFVYLNQFISPAAAEFTASGNGVLMTVLGGLGTLIGPVAGAFVLVFAENLLSTYIERWTTVLGLVFIVTIMFARDGLAGGASRLWWRWWRRRDATRVPDQDTPEDQRRSSR